MKQLFFFFSWVSWTPKCLGTSSTDLTQCHFETNIMFLLQVLQKERGSFFLYKSLHNFSAVIL